MKRKLISFVLIGIISLSLVGCEAGDVVNTGSTNNSSNNTTQTQNKPIKNRFIDTGDKYHIDGLYYKVYYDNITDTIYLVNTDIHGSGIIAIFNSQGIPMSLDEYNKTKIQIKNRFIDTGDMYNLNGLHYHVYYDSITNIIYLVNTDIHGSGITVIFNSNSKSMSLDEYNKTK